ncbi:MAG TPA: gamma-glutamyltransferase [Acidimicrobiales bacterium]|nr:gamma-glutamyltransferase [Acidimicrobiales bacterium]
MASSVPFLPRVAARGMVCAADQLASSAGVTLLAEGGSAADAVVGAAAAMAVVGPHLCGLGGDALAMVRAPGRRPEGLLGIGRAGSGADAERLRAEGHADMPLRGDIRSVPVPGAVDAWLALHARYGRLPWARVLEPAVALAEEGFAASLMLVFASTLVRRVAGAEDLCPPGGLDVGHLVRRPGLARTLRTLAAEGRDGFYGGAFGRALLALGAGEYRPEDLATPLAAWVEPLTLRALGHDLWTVPPPSQGYLSLAATWVAEQVGLPTDPADPGWAHVVAEASRVTGEDRPLVLYDGADGPALLAPARLAAWAASVDPEGPTPSAAAPPPTGRRAGARPAGLSADGDTTHLCAADGDGLAISLTQSNALDFGAHIVAGDTGVFLHNRGVGFSLEAGHPAAYGPRRRPTHTLSPAIATGPDGSATHVLGAMGGDVQPQVVLQLLARLLHSGQDPATAIAAARVVHEAPGAAPFRLWHAPARSLVMEAHAPERWKPGLEARGHTVRVIGALNPVDVGCAQVISVTHAAGHVILTGASDPRSPDGAAVGH